MNNCCNNNECNFSNSRTYEAYFTESVRTPAGLRHTLLSVWNFLLSMFRVMTCARVRATARVIGTVLCLVGLTGVIGAVELGGIGLGTGLLLGVFLIVSEFLLLRRHGA